MRWFGKRGKTSWEDVERRERVYLTTAINGEAEGIAYPHCDSKILHAPGHCEYCDRHPVLQQARVNLGINFTGESDPAKGKCPAEVDRPLNYINLWTGNVASPPYNIIFDDNQRGA